MTVVPTENNPMTKVLLVSEFKQYELDRIIQRLRALGLEPRTVDLSHKGPLDDYAAVLLMHQQCSHAKHDVLKGRAKKARVPFVLFPKETVTWPIILRKAGLRVRDIPPTAEAPVIPPTAPVVLSTEHAAEDAPPASGEVVLATSSEVTRAPRPFHVALSEERRSAELSQQDLGAAVGVSAAVVAHWEHDRVAPTEVQFQALCAVLPRMAESPPSRFSRPTTTTPKPRKSPAATKSGSKVATMAPRKSTSTPQAPCLLLDAIRKAARALHLTGTLEVKVNLESGTAKVSVAGEAWDGRSAMEAVTNTRHALEKRLRDRCAKLQTEEETIRNVLADLAA